VNLLLRKFTVYTTLRGYKGNNWEYDEPFDCNEFTLNSDAVQTVPMLLQRPIINIQHASSNFLCNKHYIKIKKKGNKNFKMNKDLILIFSFNYVFPRILICMFGTERKAILSCNCLEHCKKYWTFFGTNPFEPFSPPLIVSRNARAEEHVVVKYAGYTQLKLKSLNNI
jgi:hypothetical protein